VSTSTLDNATETVRGIVHRTFFASPIFSAGLLRTDDGQFVRFRGKFCAAEGDALALVGRWMKDPKYGHQFDAEGLSYALPETRDGLVQYLASHPAFKGNWLYTAVTRAAKTCIILGDRWGLKHAAAKNNTIKRRTFLSLWASQGGAPKS